jgi:DNA-binding SARP family transcriptional activator
MNLFTIEADGVNHEELMTRSRKGVSLIQYLVLERGRPVSSQRLIRELWSDRRSDSPENALKTMISRTRAALNAISPNLGSCIVSGQGTYRWKSQPNVRIDVLEIIDLINSLRHEPPSPSHRKTTEKLMALYRGDLYLTGDLLNGQSTFNWLHNEYLSAIYRYIELLKTTEEYTKICEVCRRAMQIDDLDEQLHIELMQAMVNLNRVDEAAAEYRILAKQSREVLDAEPSEELQVYYESLAEAGKTIRFNLDIIRNELIEKEGGTKGPFFCAYDVFKEVYNIYMRNLERLGSSMFLGVIMLGEAGEKENPVRRESCMAGLQEILKTNMRKGDIITRFSDNIFAMLLPTVNYATGSMVMERIEDLYYKEYAALAIKFFARISPLGTADP